MTNLQFRTETAATQMLRNDKRKVDWKVLPVETCPKDIAEQLQALQNYDMLYRQTKAICEQMLADKAVVPTGKRLIVTTGRVQGDSAAPVLFAFVDGSSAKSTPVVSFDQFIKG